MTITSTKDLVAGTELEPWTRTTGLETWNRFAAVNDEFVSIHMDDEAGRAAGMPGAFGPGNMLVAYLHAFVRRWMGPSGTLRDLSAEFRRPNTKGEIVLGGRIASVEQDSDVATIVTLELWVKGHDGTLLTPGAAVIRFE